MQFFSLRHFSFVFVAAAILVSPVLAQDSSPQKDEGSQRDEGTSLKDLKKSKKEASPEKKELTDQERRDRLKSFKNEVSKPYRNWLDQDVRYIISPEEEQVFKLLSTDDERDQFIEQFWLRRDPTPDTEENEFREEHYRRIQYANEHFAAGVPGWRTAVSTSSGARQTRLTRILLAANTSVKAPKAAVPPHPFPSSAGVIAIWKALATRS
jgi:GWxTD domain-containing protein